MEKQPQSKTEVESNEKESNDTLIKHQLFFAVQDPVIDPRTVREESCIVSRSKISEEFKEALPGLNS